MSSPVLLGSVLRSQSRAEQAYSWGDHALAGYLLNVVEDTTPQLGGNLDVNGFDITSATNGDIDIYPHGSGTLTLGGTGSGGTVLTAGVGAVSITTLSDNADITLDPHGTGDILLSANVGIGTSAPARPLHIVGSGGALSSAPTWPTSTSQVILESGTENTLLVFGIEATKQSFIATQRAGESYPFVRIEAEGPTGDMTIALGDGTSANATDRVRFTNDGQVGINVVPNAYGLHIRALDSVAAATNNATTFPLAIQKDDNTVLGIFTGATYESRIQFGGIADGTGRMARIVVPVDTGDMYFETGGTTEQVRIKADGKVGIGTTSPDAALHVVGEMAFTEQASAPTAAATYGYLWVKNTTPCQLWFTDDAGTSTQIV